MVTKFHKCVSLYALYARSGSVNWCKASCSLAVARLSSATCDTEHLHPHLPTSKRRQKWLLRHRPQPSDAQRVLRAAIIGAPNAGKSTLLNKLIGWKVAPVSQKVHTTRCKTLGVLTENEKQVVFLDTPGIIVPGKMKRHKLQMSLLVDPHTALFNADVVLVIVDVSHIWHQSRLDPEILKLLQLHANTPSILVLNKVDRVKKKHTLLNIVKKLTDGVVATSVNWSTEKDRTRKSTADILSKLSRETGHAEAVTSGPELYSLQQSCDLLQSSYDDLYDDDDDETSSLKTGINTNPDGVLSNTSDSTLDHTFTTNSDSALNDIGRHDATLSANTLASRGHILSKDSSDTSDSSSDHTFTPNSDSVLNDIDDRDAFSAASESDGDEPSTSEDEASLYSPDAWNLYYSRLQEIGHMMRGREGWPNFDAVFMISAVDGDGVADIKNYLLDRTYPSGWEYSSSVVTDQNPVVLAKSIIKERLLDHLPDEIPYSLQVKMSVWTVEDNYLRASFDIVCSQNRQMRQVLRHIRAIAAEAKQELMNAFRRELTLQLVAVLRGKSDDDIERLHRKKSTQK